MAVRGRNALRRFGGAARVDLGPTTLDTAGTAPEPVSTFTAQEQDRFRQWTLGAGYEGRWEGVGELSLGLQRTDYRKRIGLSDVTPVETSECPWLWNANAAVVLTDRLAAYGG